MTDGQKLALEQLEAIAAAGDALELLKVVEPADGYGRMVAIVSLRCSDIEQLPAGIKLRARERFRIQIPRDFAFAVPEVYTTHRRWAGTEHVQHARYLCLYMSKATEWDPADGMFGLIARLRLWLERAARGELDAVGGPIHPPVAYARDYSLPMFIARVDTPSVSEDTWLGLATLAPRSQHRIDITGWIDPLADPVWPDQAALAILLPRPLAWEWPTKARDLLDELTKHGVDRERLLALLRLAAYFGAENEPLYTVLGSPMRGTVGGELRQHLEVWHLDGEFRSSVRLTGDRPTDSAELRGLRADLQKAIVRLLDVSELKFADLREDRPEVVRPRDLGSPLETLRGKHVVVWGCGALGGWIAELLVRAGVARIDVYDNAAVAPGILVRQPYVDNDIGYGKVFQLRERLLAINPAVDVNAQFENVLSSALERDHWADGAAVLFDCTAAIMVAEKLEKVRRLRPQDATVVSMLVGHRGDIGMLTVSPPAFSGGPVDARRRVTLEARGRDDLVGFIDEFWPDPPRTETFQPEPGCSEATFRGSGAEVIALAATMLQAAARELPVEGADAEAVAHLIALPGADHSGAQSLRLEWPSDIVVRDGLNEYEIRLSTDALRQISELFAENDRSHGQDVETGGLLFGERDDAAGVLWVSEATAPPPDSIRSKDEFVCGVEGNEEAVAARKESGRGSLGFVGMWHTHPRGAALPSVRDVASMTQLVLAEDPPLPKSLALIIGGTPADLDIGAYVFDRKQYEGNFVVLSFHDDRVVAAVGSASSDSTNGHRVLRRHLPGVLVDRVSAVARLLGRRPEGPS